MSLRRFSQVLRYSIKDSRSLMKEKKEGNLFRSRIFIDMVSCFIKFRMWTNQYLKETFHEKSKEERKILGVEYKRKGIERDKWQREFVMNRKFLNKYTQKKYELPRLRQKRNEAYRKQYNMGDGCFVEYDVELSRQHYLPGTIKIGNNVLLAKHVFIDYSGSIEIGNNVSISDGVKILSHGHDFFGFKENIVPGTINIYMSRLIINDNVIIGTGAIIMPDVEEIGKNAIISGGSVVKDKVPDNVIIAGNPAKVIAKLPRNFKIIRTRASL